MLSKQVGSEFLTVADRNKVSIFLEQIKLLMPEAEKREDKTYGAIYIMVPYLYSGRASEIAKIGRTKFRVNSNII